MKVNYLISLSNFIDTALRSKKYMEPINTGNRKPFEDLSSMIKLEF